MYTPAMHSLSRNVAILYTALAVALIAAMSACTVVRVHPPTPTPAPAVQPVPVPCAACAENYVVLS